MEEALGLNVVQRTGAGEHICSCPLSSHGGVDRNPSFSLNVKKGVYRCWSCEGAGRTPELVRNIFGYDLDQSLNWLSQFSDYVSSSEDDNFIKQLESWSERSEPQISRTSKTRTTAGLPWFSSSVLPETEDRSYFLSRNITGPVADLLDLRFCTRWHRGDYFGPCAIIPHYFLGELRGWQERWIEFDAGAPSYVRKYMASKEFPRGSSIYGWDVVDRSQPVVVVESALTVATLMSMGHQAVATFGASVTPEQLKYLSVFPKIMLSYDNDDAGDGAVRDVARRLEYTTDVWVIPPPEHAKGDLGDCDREEVDYLIQSAELTLSGD